MIVVLSIYLKIFKIVVTLCVYFLLKFFDIRVQEAARLKLQEIVRFEAGCLFVY